MCILRLGFHAASRLLLLALACVCLPAADPLDELRQAQANGKYVLLCMWRDNKPATTDFRRRFTEAAAVEAARAVAIETRFDFNDEKSYKVISALGLQRAPMPLVLALAPNGAVTKAFPQIPAEGFKAAFVGPVFLSCLKHMQDGRMTAIVIGNSALPGSADALAVAKAFAAQPAESTYTKVVSVDPTDKAEADLFKALELPANPDAATIALILPQGQLLEKFHHPIKLEQLQAAMSKAIAGGCGPWCCE